MELIELYYYLANKPYFVVMVLSNGRKIKRFTQLAADKAKGHDVFLVNKALKAAWWKPDEVIIDNLKFLTFVNISNAIPLKIEESLKYTSNGFYTTETKTTIVSEDTEKQKKNKQDKGKENDGKPMRTVEISFPPTLLYQKVEAFFVKEILSVPPSKWEELKWVFIAGILGLVFIEWQLVSSGTISGIGH